MDAHTPRPLSARLFEAGPDDHLWEKFLTGECSLEEHAHVEAWMHADPNRERIVEAWGRAVKTPRFDVERNGARLQQRFWAAVSAARENSVVAAAQPKPGRRGAIFGRNSFGGRSLRKFPVFGRDTLRRGTRHILSTTLVVALGIAVIFRARLNGIERHSEAVLTRIYATPVGQQANITLADGSRVFLGPATRLSVARDRTGSLNIRLSGQALFTVQHQRGHAFQVSTDRALIQVLGTTFLVRQYDTDRRTRVAVASGRVSVFGIRGNQARLGRVLMARTLGVIGDSGTVQVTPNILFDDYTAWTTGKLVFHNTLARDAVLEVGRAYGVMIRITDSTLAAQRLDATISLSKRSLEGVLESLVKALDAHSVRDGRVITLVPGRLPVRRPVNPFSSSYPESSYGR